VRDNSCTRNLSSRARHGEHRACRPWRRSDPASSAAVAFASWRPSAEPRRVFLLLDPQPQQGDDPASGDDSEVIVFAGFEDRGTTAGSVVAFEVQELPSQLRVFKKPGAFGIDDG